MSSTVLRCARNRVASADGSGGGGGIGNRKGMMSEWEAHIAIKHGDVPILRQQLNSGNLNANVIFRHDTLLATAINENQVEILQLLLEFGADPNLKSYENGRNEPPIITATRLGNLRAVQLLLLHGASISSGNFYGQDAIFRAVYENAFPILQYFLLNLNAETHSHFPRSHVYSENGFNDIKKNCPLMLAIKDAPVYPLKKRCLLLLLKHNYSCSCLTPDCSVFSEIYECEYYYKIYESDPDILRWIYLAKGLRVHYMQRRQNEAENEASAVDGGYTISRSSRIELPLKLTNLARIVVRGRVAERAVSTKSNFTINLLKLPLPKQLVDFLLMSDLESS